MGKLPGPVIWHEDPGALSCLATKPEVHQISSVCLRIESTTMTPERSFSLAGAIFLLKKYQVTFFYSILCEWIRNLERNPFKAYEPREKEYYAPYFGMHDSPQGRLLRYASIFDRIEWKQK